MQVNKLKCVNFRNIEQTEIEPCQEMNVIYGENAQGKTNLLEAIWLFTGAKSFRSAKDSAFLKNGSSKGYCELDFSAEGTEYNAEMEFDEKTDNGKVHQTLKDCVLTTTIKSEEECSLFGISEKVLVKEETKMEQTLPEGTILIWSEESGYIIPTFQMTTLEELIEDANAIKEIYSAGGEVDDTKGNEG